MTDIPAEERHANGRKVRKEALPEYAPYKDVGCDLAPSCLACPFVVCRYDLPSGIRELLVTLEERTERHQSQAQLRETQSNGRNHHEPINQP
ncbi:MAG: hypothetical protein IIC91_01655 [Chloroflexi bacterium]|nr:hypothetical protein [Chloroflexota bacterium]